MWEYMAGWFDSNGCVNITESKGRHRLQVVVTKSDEGFLNELRDMVGMGIVSKNDWRMVTQEAENFLRSVEPYSIRKKDEIEVALKFRDTIGRPSNFGRRGLTGSVKEERDKLMEELRRLK